MNLTRKQLQILAAVIVGNDAAGLPLNPLDLDELIDQMDWMPTKQSIQFSVRALIKYGLIYKGTPTQRRGRIRVIYFPTELGKKLLETPASAPISDPVFEGFSDPLSATAAISDYV